MKEMLWRPGKLNLVSITCCYTYIHVDEKFLQVLCNKNKKMGTNSFSQPNRKAVYRPSMDWGLRSVTTSTTPSPLKLYSG